MPPRSNRTRQIFGIPTSLAGSEASEILKALGAMWAACYGHPPDILEEDLALCRRYFDPVARGATLRERLAGIGGHVRIPAIISSYLVPPLVIEIGDNKHLVGVEARLIIDVLERATSAALVSVSLEESAALEKQAADLYREWATARLRDVIALRRGTGKEVMQAVSVGVVLVLLINRSTAPSRALVDRQGRLHLIDEAIYKAAESFADVITTGRGRSSGEKKLKGGYALSEAKRRLAERIVIEPLKPKKDEDRTIYLAEGSEHDVLTFLASDLARRTSLDALTLAKAFDRLVTVFKEQTEPLATHSAVHERPAETARTRNELLESFQKAKPTISPVR